MRLPQPALADPGLAALKIAARAAIVMPAVFAVAYQLIQQPQTAIFASFGSFAILILVDFSGSPRSRLIAYLSLAVIGALLVIVGTVCSRNAWLAAAAMAVVGFAILFSGVISGYIAAASTAAILAFVLPVSIPAPLSAVGWRLAGWGLAAAAGICAVMLLWPPRRSETLRGQAGRTCLALADLAHCALAADEQARAASRAAAEAAVAGLRTKLEALPHRPTGPTGPATALAALIDELQWLLVSLEAVAGPAVAELCRDENVEAMAAAALVLRASGARLAGRAERPDLGRLELAQAAVVQTLAQRISQPPADSAGQADQDLESLVGQSFRIRTICYTTRQIAGYALAASGAAPEPPDDARVGQRRAAAAWRLAPRPAVLQAVRQFAADNADTHSVWFRNSIRAAAGLAIAVFVAQRSGLQHSFWVVLGTLSVLRSNALGTGRSVLSALAGTAAGIVVGAAIILALGASDPVLWGVLPVAVLVAAYTPRVVSFAAGQAAFTVVLLVLFNIIEPTGWKVGLLRFEDVAIGFAVSLGVGLLFWPRGAAAVLRENLAIAYSRAADYVAITARLLTGGAHRDPGPAAQAAAAAVDRLDDAFRQYLAERSAKRVPPETPTVLVAGAARVLRAGRSMAALDAMLPGDAANGSLSQYRESMNGQVDAVRSWYVTLGDSLAHGTSVPAPQPADPQASRRLLRYVRDSIAGGEASARHSALLVLWASQHLETLRRLEAHLAQQAGTALGVLPGR